MIKKIACVFITLDNSHLSKDIGQIGNFFAELDSDVKPVLVCCNDNSFPSLKTEAKNQSIHVVENKGRVLFFEIGILQYFMKEAKKIDFLHIQQLNKANIYYALFYKLINPKGKLLLKLDMHIPDLKKRMFYSKKKMFNSIHKFYEKKMLRKTDLIAADSTDLIDAFAEEYEGTENKLVLLSHNLNDKFLDESFPNKRSFEEKENIILTTGRIGAFDKNYEMLLETIPLLNLEDWKVVFVGKIHNDFDKKVEQLIFEHPHLSEKIELTGNIDDRLELYEHYNRSKVFCLTSVLESFGVAYIEALYFGNYVIGTDGMSSFDYISGNQSFGHKVRVNNREELATCLNDIIQGEKDISGAGIKANKHVAEHFYWSKNIQALKKITD